MRFETQETWWLRVTRRLVPYIPEEAWVAVLVWYIARAPRLDFLGSALPSGGLESRRGR